MAHKTVGNNLKQIRTERRITQSELAVRVGVARVSIISIEKGHFIPTIETALRIARALQTPVERIFWLLEYHV